MMPSNHLILCRPLLLPPSIFPSIRVFPNESALRIKWPKYWSFSIGPSSEYSGHRHKQSPRCYSGSSPSRERDQSKHTSIHLLMDIRIPPRFWLSQIQKWWHIRISLEVQWLRLCVPRAGGPDSIPAQGTRSHNRS